jgi:hypothetical protein
LTRLGGFAQANPGAAEVVQDTDEFAVVGSIVAFLNGESPFEELPCLGRFAVSRCAGKGSLKTGLMT